jgi:hypothetical protein
LSCQINPWLKLKIGLTPISTRPIALVFLQQTTRKVFEQVEASVFQNIPKQLSRLFGYSISLQKNIDFRPLYDPGNFVEGGIWAGFWGLCALFSGISLYELYHALTIEHSASEKFAKIGKVVKTAFVDLVSLGGTTAYNIHWAHEVKILSLGQYAPLIKSFGLGASLIVNIIEGGSSTYNIYAEQEAISKETLPEQREKHKQRLYLSFMKLIGNISIIAWAMLGIAAIAGDLAVSSIVMSTLLMTGCIFPIAAFFYQRHIENAPELCPFPKFNFSR